MLVKLAVHSPDNRTRFLVTHQQAVEGLRAVIDGYKNRDIYITGEEEPVDKEWKPGPRLACYYSLELGISVLCYGLIEPEFGNYPGFSQRKPPCREMIVELGVEEFIYKAETAFFHSSISGLDFLYPSGSLYTTQDVQISSQQFDSIVKLLENNDVALTPAQKTVFQQIVKD